VRRYTGRHRKADTVEIQRILGLADAPERTMEEIANNQEPAWTSVTRELAVVTPRTPRRRTFSGPPAWRLLDRMKWILIWRLNAKLQQNKNGYRLV
jgi:hypothetical protein